MHSLFFIPDFLPVKKKAYEQVNDNFLTAYPQSFTLSFGKSKTLWANGY